MDAVKKVLWIDDDDTILDAYKLKFEKTGRFQVTTTTDGSRVIEMTRDVQPDIIITDIKMPFVNGADVANLLRGDETTKGIPILFLSSLVGKKEMDDTGGFIGGRHMASKAASVPEIIAKVDAMLKSEES